MNGPLGLLVAVLLLFVNAFFVAAEFALISTRRSSIEPLAARGSMRARVTLAGMEQASLLLAGSQLGITLASLGLGAVAEPSVAHELERFFDAVGAPEGLLHPVSFVIALLIVVFLHVVIGEMIPKNLAIAGPERAALFLVPALRGLVRLLRPAIAGLNWLANLTLRAVRITPQDEVTSAFTREEVAGLIAESHQEGLLDAGDHDNLAEALGFESRTASAVLLPLDQLVTVAPSVTPEEVEQLSAATGFSRFPVRENVIGPVREHVIGPVRENVIGPVVGESDDLIGYLHLKEVLETDPVRRTTPVAAKRIRPLLRIGIDDSLGSVLRTMQTNGAHLARATDADGQLLGVVALEDVLAELIGEAVG